MAKKAQLRVHKLAKELGISSKDVIAKCEAEGIPGIENHLSPVSIGLAATIREWFSKAEDAEESTTAVKPRRKLIWRRPGKSRGREEASWYTTAFNHGQSQIGSNRRDQKGRSQTGASSR